MCHSVRAGGAAPDEICVLLLQVLSSCVLAHTCTAIDANGQAMRMVRRCEWPGDANGQAMRIARRWEWSGDANGHANPHERIACESLCDPATHLHAQFSNQQTHGQMNNKTKGRFCSHKSRGPLSASSCDKEWGRGAKPPKNFWGPAAAAAAAHLDPHLLMNTNMPRRDFTCRSRWISPAHTTVRSTAVIAIVNRADLLLVVHLILRGGRAARYTSHYLQVAM